MPPNLLKSGERPPIFIVYRLAASAAGSRAVGAKVPRLLLHKGGRLRVCVYIDGFNLYYRALKGTQHKWLNVQDLARQLLEPSDTIEFIRYFTADVSPRSGDLGAPARQQAYFRALRTIPNLDIKKGRFLPKTKWRPLVGQESKFVQIHDTEEKGSDVNLATHLLNDAFHKRFEAALVLSQDTDLIEPLRIVKHEMELIVGVGWLDKSMPGKKHKGSSDFIRHVNSRMLRSSQFPNPVIGKGGIHLPKPLEW